MRKMILLAAVMASGPAWADDIPRCPSPKANSLCLNERGLIRFQGDVHQGFQAQVVNCPLPRPGEVRFCNLQFPLNGSSGTSGSSGIVIGEPFGGAFYSTSR